jgi:hypothetical protein
LEHLPKTKAIVSNPLSVGAVMGTLRSRCNAKVHTLQKRKRGLGERYFAVEVFGVGVLSTVDIMTMTQWHKAVENNDLITTTLKW